MLKNKTVAVMGAGGLLGSRTVKDLLNHNAKIIAVDLDIQFMTERLIAHGINIDQADLTLTELDICCETQVKTFFQTVKHLDGAVNCTYPRNKSYGKHFFDVTLSDFNENLTLHLGSSFLLIQQCASYFLRNERPFSLVNIASIYGVVAPKFNIYMNTSMTMPVEYAAIKSAIIHLNKYAVKYVSHSDFRVNSVSPGGILDGQAQEFLKLYRDQSLGKGMLDVEDVTGTILFLLSDYSKHMNGQNLVVDDGFSL